MDIGSLIGYKEYGEAPIEPVLEVVLLDPLEKNQPVTEFEGFNRP